MQDSITAYLVQAKECSLPGIGHFKIISHTAASDGINKTILPPYNEVIFSDQASQEVDGGLIKYIAAKLDLDEDATVKQLKIFCISLNNRLSIDRMVVLSSLGKLLKDNDGNITFDQEGSIELFEPVVAERVVHENANHIISVGDKEVNSDKSILPLHLEPEVLEEDFVAEEPNPKKQWWKVAALILFVLAVGIIILQFYNHGVETGSQSPIYPKDPVATYK